MHVAASHAEPSPEPAAGPPCPLCNGQLVPLHGAYRCARCSFILCAGCETSPSCGTPPDD